MSTDNQQAASFELDDQSTSPANMVEAYHSDSNQSGSETSCEEGSTDIFDAIEKGEEADVKLFLEKGIDLNEKKDGSTPLHLAIEKNRKEIALLLLEKNNDGSYKWDLNISLKNTKGKKPASLVKSKRKKNPDDKNWRAIEALLEQTKVNCSAVRKLSDTTGDGPDSKKSKLDVEADGSKRQGTDQGRDPPKQPRTDPALDPDPTYAASGLKRALDGTIYQSKLLGLFVRRGVKKEHDFRLATEMDAAEKFDDVVFKYQDKGKWIFRFLQAKHKQDPENKKITINDLRSTSNDNPFSLQKYVISFCNIKDKALFEGAFFKDFVIITNTDFEFSEKLKLKDPKGHTDRWKGYFEEDNEKENNLEKDEILYFKMKDFKAKKYKFNNNAKTDLTEIIKSTLLKSALETKEIEDLSSAKEKLEATKVFTLKDLITQANEAVKNIKNECESKKRKGEILKEARNVLKLKGQILEENKYTDLKRSIVELKKASAKDKTNHTQKDKLDQDQKDVLYKANNLLNEAKKKLNESENLLDEYKTMNTNKFNNLEKDKNKLRDIDDYLKKIKDKISKSETTLDDIKKGVKEEALTKRIPKVTLNYIKKKMTLDLEEVKKTLVKRLEEAISEISVIRLALNDATLDAYLEHFLMIFRFVTNYPNEKELGGFIKNELGEEFHLLNADLASDSFEREMLDFLKSYDKGKAKFYSWEDGEDFFRKLKEKINTLMISGLNKAYPEKLRAYGARFKSNLKGLKDFLSSEKQIFHISSQSTRLSAIKVLQTLESNEENCTYLARDGYIFIRLRTVLLEETKKCTIDAFSSVQSHNLLIIECQSKNRKNGDEIDQLYTQLSRVLNGNLLKKIILIALGEDDFAAKFKTSHENKIKDKTSFKDLDPKSQDTILERKVNFQGKHVRLNELIDKNSASKVINHVSLLRLLEEEKIPIGDKKHFSSIGFVKDYYIPRIFHRQKIETKVLKEKIGSELFFITGTSVGNLTYLGVEEKDIHPWEDKKTYKNGIILDPLSQSDKSNKEIFQKLGENVHWLEYYESNLFWRSSAGNLSALQKYIDKNEIKGKIKINILKEEDFSDPEAFGQKVIILANDPGVGKSTVLTNIVRKMKQKNPALWVVRLNLNDYAVDKEKPHSLHNIKFQENETKGVIDFVSKMAVPGNEDDPDIQFHRKLFEAGLKGNTNKNPKIVILFDGFDEISPSYKTNTTKLIKALKTSNLTQLWVTTRVHEKADLEKELESPAYFLNPLTKEEKDEFLNKFWRCSFKFLKEKNNQEAYDKIISNLKVIKSSLQEYTVFPFYNKNKEPIERLDGFLKEHPPKQDQITQQLESLRATIDKLDFSDYVRRLRFKFKNSILDTEKAFTNVPLNLRMLAELIFEKKFPLAEDMGLFDLYDEFKKVKFNIYHQDKNKISKVNEGANETVKRDMENLSRVHYELAVNLLFPEEYKKNSLPGLDELSRFQNEELARVGLVTLEGDRLEFIHRSFAEYFFNEYLVKNLENEQVQKLLMEKIMLKNDYELIRKFLIAQLEKNPLSEDILKKAIEKSIAEANNFSEHIGTAAQKITEFLFQRFKEQPDTFHELVVKTDEKENSLLHLFNNNIKALINFKTLKNWIEKNLRTGTLEELVDKYGSWFLESENHEVIDYLLRKMTKVECFIPPEIRYLLDNDIESVYENFSESEVSDNESYTDSLILKSYDNARHIKARKVLISKLKPFLQNLQNVYDNIENASSEREISYIIDTITDRIEENRKNLEDDVSIGKQELDVDETYLDEDDLDEDEDELNKDQELGLNQSSEGSESDCYNDWY